MPATVDRRPRLIAPVHRVVRRIGLGTLARIGIVAGTAVAAVLAVRAFGREYVFFDLRIYHGAVAWWAHGGDLYQYVAPGITLGFTYPPFAALVMEPMVLLSAHAAGWVNLLASLVVLGYLLAALINPIADRHGWPRWFALGVALPLAAAIDPVRETLGYGQVNLLLAGLVVGDLVALRWRTRAAAAGRLAAAAARRASSAPVTASLARPASVTAPAGRAGALGVPDAPAPQAEPAPWVWLRRAWLSGAFAGAGVGLATAIKLTPGLFIVYFVITRQWRAALTATLTALGATALAFVLAGHESMAYFTGVLWDTGRVGAVDATPNQSLAGVLARLYDSPVTPGLMWLAFAVLLLAVGLSRASNAHREGDELAAFTIVALTANAICPISWTHHLVFVVPALVVLVDSALRRRRAARGLNLGRFPALAGLRHALAAVALYALFLVSPIWLYEHKYPEVSHYADGRFGALWENSLALAVIMLVVLLPWRSGAEPAFYGDARLRGS